MAYDTFDRTHPVITDTRQDVVDETRYNLNALADALLMGGNPLPGYAYSWSTGTASDPENIYYKNGNDWIHLDITWGSGGGEDGNPTEVGYYYSDDAGSNWATMGIQTFTWTVDGDLASTAWS